MMRRHRPCDRSSTDNEHPRSADPGDEPIAIVGMACRFPGGARDPAAFWSLLREGRDVITDVPASRWDRAAYHDPTPSVPGKAYAQAGGFLDGLDLFDPHLFGIAPREAEAMDPQQRLLLEVAWEALEHAGQAPCALSGSATGVFVGISNHDYVDAQNAAAGPTAIVPHACARGAFSVAAGRISHVLGLRGPALAVDTACSSSLVAVHLAAQSLRCGETDLALAGGVNALLYPGSFIGRCQALLLSPRGRCRAFDASADGYAPSEGCGVVVLKRLVDATDDRDAILAVIRGSAVNQGGLDVGRDAPSGQAQQDVIRQALARAGLRPASISYVEADGKGSSLGDAAEANALGAVFAADREAGEPLILGSLKTNVGHLESAAGVAGLIKVVLAFQHRQIPPHLHLEEVNPGIDLERLRLAIARELIPWQPAARPRRAGISAFGLGGTYAHLIVEEAAPVQQAAEAGIAPDEGQPAAAKAVPTLYEVTWRPSPEAAGASAAGHAASAEEPITQWLLVADRGGVAAALEARLQQRGHRCERIAPESDVIAARLFAGAQADDRGPLGVLFLSPLDGVYAAAADQQRVLGGALRILQQLIEAQARSPSWAGARLWLVTREAQGSGDEDRPAAVGGAPLWGFGRVVGREHPELWGGLIDLTTRESAQAAKLLEDELLAAHRDREAAWRYDEDVERMVRFVSRLVPVSDGPEGGRVMPIRPDGTYLITGGLGRLGLATARWLAARGARYVALISRRTDPAGRAGRILEGLAAQGVTVRVLPADVADRRALASALAEVRATLPELVGVVHAAGVTDEGPLQQLSWPRLAAVLAPKVDGAVNLTALVSDADLDFCALFSSVSALVGTPGQAGQAAASAFMDTLADTCQHRGIPAVSINWGPWSEEGGEGEGARTSDPTRQQLDVDGMASMDPESALDLLPTLLARGSTQVVAAAASWSALAATVPQPPTLLAEVLNLPC